MKRSVFLLALLLPAAALASTGVDALLPFVPANAKVVVAVDSAALRAHPAVQQWLIEHQAPWSGVDDEGAAFLRDAGLDPLRDVDAMVFALSFEGDSEAALALFGGRYDPASLGAALVKQGATRLTVAGRDAYLLPEHADDSAEAIVLAPSTDLVVCGSRALVAAALGAGGSAGSTLVRVEVASGRLDPSAPFWMAVAIPDLARHRAGAGDGDDEEIDSAMRGVAEASRAVRRVTGWATLNDSLALHGFALADTVENAELLRDAVKGALAALRLQAQGEAAELVEVLREVEVGLDGTTLAVHATVPIALLEKLGAGHRDECRHHHHGDIEL